MSGNITRAEAQQRSSVVHVSYYKIELDLNTGPERFRSTTTVEFSSRQPGSPTWIDLIAARVEAITYNDVPLDPAEVFDGERLHLPSTAELNVLQVIADCDYMNTGEGLHRFVDPVDGEVYLYTQFETADARRMYACFEQPDLKATYRLSVTAPDHWHVVSNTNVRALAPTTDGEARWEFAPTKVMSTYITALIAGPYHRVTDTYQGAYEDIPLGIYCRASMARYLDEEAIFDLTKRGFAFFEGTFAMGYPFGKYDQLFVPEFNAGAMENAGAVTFREDYVFRSRVTRAAYEARANTILHEMAHMWFGDLVTMRWWDDLWLNESFAEWASHHASVQATEFTEAWTSFANGRKAWAYRQDQLPSTHPIAADMVDLDAVQTNFDGITYAKGASALKQLVAWVGEEEFIAGLRTYFEQYAWHNTELADLLEHLERSSGRDLSSWSRQWLQTSGANLLRLDITTGADGSMEEVAIIQEPPSAPPGLAPVLRDHRLRVGLFNSVDGELRRVDTVELDVTGARTVVPELAGRARPDLLLLNDGDLTYAKIRLDERSIETAVGGLAQVSDSLARSLIWGAAWDMARDAELTAGQFVDLVISGIPGETEIGVVQNVIGQAYVAVNAYAAPANRQTYRERLATAVRGWIDTAEPDSDRQLAMVRALALVATLPEHTGFLAGLLEGSDVVQGLAVDTDLRWTLLIRLSEVGLADEARIDAELQRDATAAGQRKHAEALASRPEAAAKEAAWAACVDRDELPNAMLVATAYGFVHPEQEELMRPYRDRYFAALPGIWQTRTFDTASTLTQILFPSHLVEQDTLDAADAFLAQPQHPGAARLVGEGRDTVARSLRAQAADGA